MANQKVFGDGDLEESHFVEVVFKNKTIERYIITNNHNKNKIKKSFCSLDLDVLVHPYKALIVIT
jgi:hypothetical protein